MDTLSVRSWWWCFLFWFNLVFLLVILSRIFASSSHLLSLKANLSSLNEHDFILKVYVCPHGVKFFHISTFLSLTLKYSRCMSASGPSSRTWNSFFILFIHSTFLCSFCYHILLQIWLLFCPSGFSIYFYH